MFDSPTPGQMQGPVHVAAIAHVAREARWSLTAKRSYLVPTLLWITGGQGRMAIDGDMRGFTANNAIFLPANTEHAVEITPRIQGLALFFNASSHLSCPDSFVHLRLHGLERQAFLNRMVDDIAREASSGAADAETMLFHQSALLMCQLRRLTDADAVAPAPQAADMSDAPRRAETAARK